MTDDIGFKIYAAIDGLNSSMQQASQSVEKFADNTKSQIAGLSNIFGGIKTAAEAFIAALAVEKVEAFFEKFAGQATEINKLEAAFGLTTAQVQELQFAMQATGGGDGLQGMLSRLSVALEKAIDNVGPQRKAFEDMGISLQFLKDNANNVPAVLNAVADAVKRMGGAQQNAADLTLMMGRAWAQNAGLLNEGADGIRELSAAAEETGGVMSNLEKEQFEGVHRSLATMNESFNGLGITLATAFAPAFKAVVDGITEFVSALDGGSDKVSVFRLALVPLVAALDAIVLAVEMVKVAIVSMYQIMTIAADSIYYGFVALGKVITDFLHGDFSHMGKDWDDTMVAMNNSTAQHIAAIKAQVSSLGQTVTNMGQGIAGLEGDKGAPDAPLPKKKTGPTAEEIKDAQDAATLKEQMAKEQITTELELSKLGLAGKKSDLDAEVDAGKITQQQKIQALEDYTTLEYQANMDALDKEKNLYDQDSLAYQQILDKKLIATAKYQNDIAKLNADAAKVQEQENKKLADTINHAFDTMLTGVLQGTQTWQQAMARMFDNLAITFLEKAANMALDWALQEAQKTAATLAGNAARTASTTAAAGEGLAVQAASATKSVGMSAGQAAASVYADVAAIPYIGWLLAPPAAAAAFVAVEAFGSGFSASGGFDIPAGLNPMTQLHSQEMVLPANLANKVRNMTDSSSGGGGTSITIHVSAIDTQSGMDFINDQAENIAATIQQQIRNGNPALTGHSLTSGR